MAEPQFTIPEELQNSLHFVEARDKRSDEDILQSLEQFQPVTSEKNIWAFWDKGVRKLPGWNRRNVLSWIRLCGPSWTVRVLDSIPESPNYALKHVSKDLLPDVYVNGTMRGPYVGPHSADFLRGACLYTHGGVFMDVGNILVRDFDSICWRQLEDPTSPFEVSIPHMYGLNTANHFVAARKGNPFVKAWHDIFCTLWKGRQDHRGIIEDPLMTFAKSYNFNDPKRAAYHWEFTVDPTFLFEYIGQILSWARLCMLEDTGRGFSGVEYWQTKVLVFDALQEDWPAESVIGFSGPDIAGALATRLDAPKDSQEYQDAYKVTWRILSRSSMQKIAHGKGLTKTPNVGVIWEEEGNENMDCEPGTFAELLRYGTVHFEQTRQEICFVKAEAPQETLKSKLLEP